MCGIVGYVGFKPVVDILLNGLSKLEYRGYDSAGIAVNSEGKIKVYKAEGKLQNLKDLIEQNKSEIIETTAGIGHIRWATHGLPNTINAHPHTCNCGKLAIVHNGIVENYKELKTELLKEGCVFKSETDTEVVAHLIAHEYGKLNDLPKAVRAAAKRLKGAYALCVMHQDEPNILVGTRKNAPLIVAMGQGENFLASDSPAIIQYTKRVIYLDDDQVAVLTPSSVLITDIEGRQIDKKEEILPWEPVAMSKMGYKHFMLKEIHEQPDVIRNVLSGKLPDINKPIVLDEVKLTKDEIKNLKRIEIIACGTSLHAAMVAKYILEAFTNIPVDVEASSEYIYRKTVTDANTLVIGISQSGETSDTITAIRQAKSVGSHVLIITNRPDSIMAREAHSLIPVNAGIEVSVAATKSFNAQLIALYLFAMYIAEIKGSFDSDKIKTLKHEMLLLPQKIETVLSHKDDVIKCARAFASYKNFIYIARGINFPTALEGALKLKEISYINATGYPAGELKHGPIAMLDETMPVLAILMPGSIVYEKVLSNAEEAKARNARMIALTSADDKHLEDVFEYILKVPEVDEYLSPVIASVPLQLLAYYIAEFLGKDVDQPRNLAKSVTVE
ncbi:MAG: glutamine--fructose-6-phosphate transaminase (isomerizing) [Clostridium sp.]|nr:glutamine--fructose-6-phosphate transaminase (isomerizing) [Clostridium sp.]